MASSDTRTIPDLASDAISQLAKLIGNEFALARAELALKADQAKRSAAMIGAGAVLAIPGLVILLMAAAAGLMHAGMSDPVAYLIVGGVAVLIAVALVMLGLSGLSGEALKPSVTLEQVQRDKAASKEMMR